jgi:spore germination cell wall hydrolase CwlJ-like protein
MMVRSILLVLILVISTLAHAADKDTNPTPAELQCLTRAVYFEANHSDINMQEAVASVIINRVNDPRYPKTICGVVHQQVKKTCQFSWYCAPKKPIDDAMWQSVLVVTTKMLQLWSSNAQYDVTNGATHFHDSRVKPYWIRSMDRTYTVKTLAFYRD